MTEKHNELRSNLALGKDTTGGNSAASDMNAISYDLDLEYVAQCHINRCDFNHDKCRLTTKFSKTVGQNLYTGTHKLTDEESIKHIVQTCQNKEEITLCRLMLHLRPYCNCLMITSIIVSSMLSSSQSFTQLKQEIPEQRPHKIRHSSSSPDEIVL
ncbi:hypothetical protein NQ317_018160 [Molorchus minor]|uniref:SCP domain-containing protein n=1 Tax=Molorchus minor TaxID=1323400 RepID=A0ABQ9J1S7_9CUCU|nr:hypothetical protein NQ317_018160 [Molorchus minor]